MLLGNTTISQAAEVSGFLDAYFRARHSKSEDLGLRLHGEQLAAGVRFVRMAREGVYDLVVGNPPYQALSKTGSFGYVAKTYPRAKADLYAAFLERGLEFVKPGGVSGLLTMRGWMFLGQFVRIRAFLLHEVDLRLLGDLDRGAFEDVLDEVLATVMSVIRRGPTTGAMVTAVQPTILTDGTRDGQRTARKRAAVLAHVGRYEFDPLSFKVIEGEPIVYWWTKEFLDRYAEAPKLGEISPGRKGLCTGADVRFTRKWWEIGQAESLAVRRFGFGEKQMLRRWTPSINGGEGLRWFEPLREVCPWEPGGLEFHTFALVSRGIRIQNACYYFEPGVAFSMVGATCHARAHRVRSVFLDKGSSVFPPKEGIPETLCLMNSSISASVLSSLNPTISFQVGDVNRLPLFPIESAGEIFATIESAFGVHESTRETSIEFRQPGASPWVHAQAWAQSAVDRPPGDPLPGVLLDLEPPPVESFISFAVGVALGRFDTKGEGILSASPRHSLPGGTLFVSIEGGDSLEHPASSPIHAAWEEHGPISGEGGDLRTYLRKSFFAYHKKLYENRPTYFPLASARKSFVAFISIHRWQDDTLNVLLADHLVDPARRRLEGELEDLRAARASGSNKAESEKRFVEVQKLLEELNDFIVNVTEIAESGPPRPDAKTPLREVDAQFTMDLDDGVMVNSAALWALLEPQWKDPKKWWKELATAQGKKDYDWSRMAARYFPTRVRAKCHEDPSLAVAHKCFWELHPAKAYAWELRLQDEIRPDFTIDEPVSDAARRKFLADHDGEARKIVAAEAKRRERKAAKADAKNEGKLALRERDEYELDEIDDD